MLSSSIVTLLLVISLWFGLTYVCCSSSGPGSSRSSPTLAPRSVTAKELIQDYKANEVRADENWKDRMLTVNGVVESIGKDIVDTPYITLTGDGQLSVPSVQCMFDGNASTGQLTGLDKGSRITVGGVCHGKLFNVILRNCSLQ